MLRYTSLLVLTFFLHADCFAQESPINQTTSASEQSAGSLKSSSENLAETDTIANVSVGDFLILTFILVMFTYAVRQGSSQPSTFECTSNFHKPRGVAFPASCQLR